MSIKQQTHGYELLDFGSGRKLERWGGFVLDRPCPAAEPFEMRRANLWKKANVKFCADFHGTDSSAVRGRWDFIDKTLSSESAWTVKILSNTMELRFSPFGHIGVFPEQFPLWERIASLISRRVKNTNISSSVRVLNLFAYTGGSTLACAAAGAEVVHIDSAKNLLARARHNAQLSDLENASVRWIAEDAVRFVQREIKRNSRYDAVILDPPSYGHGTGRNVWQLTRDLTTLLHLCFELLSENPVFLLLSCHTPTYDTSKLVQILKSSGESSVRRPLRIDSFPLSLATEFSTDDQRKLPSGFAAFALFD